MKGMGLGCWGESRAGAAWRRSPLPNTDVTVAMALSSVPGTAFLTSPNSQGLGAHWRG